ncbi:CAP-Gly domain-containing linker protein 4-like [Centruroides sculpturatus]|uniref:CAP-Gly domain-containing linker protein 4-like n=1 Tax=Centruroides sculpturatus TaxID=218467 RepID=UPI000C6E71B5|nr:CAP-Gly domain-containing linker protein 4-like [Centruroides sculpturatus]
MTVSLNKHREKDNSICNIKEKRTYPIIHPTSDAPLCSSCEQLELPFFDPSCPGCMEILKNQNTSISQIFAIIRQWMPQTQQNIQVLVNEILKRGAHVDDRDGLTDMTILQYACKAGAIGVGDAYMATETVKMMLDKGADTRLKCRWTDMTALHYAVYFDVVPVLEVLLETDKNIDINIPCQEFDGGTSLHIAAYNLCVEATKILIKYGADVNIKDDFKRTPYDCIPQISEVESMSDVVDIICHLRKLLQNKIQYSEYDLVDYSNITGRTVLKSLRLKLGDKVIVGGAKVGILRYCGTTKFAPGIWAGVELEEPLGKNNGTIEEVTYFRCSPCHGIFAPISKICKYSVLKSNLKTNVYHRSLLPRHINHPRIDISRITSKIETGLSSIKSQSEAAIGDRVYVSGRSGTIKYIGETKFALGIWYGIELDKPEGKNDGCIHGIKYFTCKPHHGLFVSHAKITKYSTSRRSDSVSDHSSSVNLNLSNSRSSTDGENEMSSLESQHSTRSMKHKRSYANTTNLNKDCWLAIGTNIFVKNEIATVRYIGNVEFASGIWLGVELRKPKGKNDGSVQGHRYFSCKPNHGLMVRPNRVTVRGINGSKLLDNFNK